IHTVTRLGIAISLLAAVVVGQHVGQADPSVEVAPQVRIYGATAEQVDLGRWAVGRFESAGLEAPPVEIHFHGDAEGCGGHLGYAKAGKVDVCTTLVNAMARCARCSCSSAACVRGTPPRTLGESGATSRAPRSSPGRSASGSSQLRSRTTIRRRWKPGS